MRISDWSSDVCSSDLVEAAAQIDADHFVPIFKAHIQESAVARNACIVDHNIDRAHVFGDLRAKVFAGVKVAHVPFIISYAGAPGEGLRSFGITRIIGRDCYPHVAKGKADRFTNATRRSEEHTSELQSLMRTSYAVFCLNNK